MLALVMEAKEEIPQLEQFYTDARDREVKIYSNSWTIVMSKFIPKSFRDHVTYVQVPYDASCATID